MEISSEDNRLVAKRLASEMKRGGPGRANLMSSAQGRYPHLRVRQIDLPRGGGHRGRRLRGMLCGEPPGGPGDAELAGLGSVIVQCPVATAAKIARTGRLVLGWVAARVEMLKAPHSNVSAAWPKAIRRTGALPIQTRLGAASNAGEKGTPRQNAQISRFARSVPHVGRRTTTVPTARNAHGFPQLFTRGRELPLLRSGRREEI